MTATAAGNWVVIRCPSWAGPNYRVFNTVTHDYHRGTNEAVRVYRDYAPAQRRADALNGGSTPTSPRTPFNNERKPI